MTALKTSRGVRILRKYSHVEDVCCIRRFDLLPVRLYCAFHSVNFFPPSGGWKGVFTASAVELPTVLTMRQRFETKTLTSINKTSITAAQHVSGRADYPPCGLTGTAYILLMVDYFTRFLWAKSYTRHTAMEVVSRNFSTNPNQYTWTNFRILWME